MLKVFLNCKNASIEDFYMIKYLYHLILYEIQTDAIQYMRGKMP